MGDVCSTHKKLIFNFNLKNLKGLDHLEGQSVDEMIILKCIFGNILGCCGLNLFTSGYGSVW